VNLRHEGDLVTELVTRAQAFGLIAAGVATSVGAPWRLRLARRSRYLSLGVGGRAEWHAWRTHLGCPELTVRVDADSDIRRSSVAEVVLDGCRISVELVEEVSTDDLDQLRVADPTPVEPEER